MAPPIFEKQDPATGRPKKREFGPWMMTALRVLARLKFLRGTPLDPFGHLKDRREERALIKEYEQMIDLVLSRLDRANYNLCVQILNLPSDVRGYGPIKDANIKRFRVKRLQLQTDLVNDREEEKAAA